MKKIAVMSVILVLAVAQLACALPFELPFSLPFGLGAPTETPTPLPSPTRPVQPTRAPTTAATPTRAATPLPATPTRVGANPTPVTSGGKLSDKDGFYSFTAPAALKVTARGNGHLLCADDKGSMCLSITLRIKALYPEYVLEDVLRSLEARNQDFVELSRDDIAVGNYAGLLSQVKYTQNKVPLEGQVRVVTRNRVAYELSTWYPAGSAAAAGALFDPLLKSFTITDFVDTPLFEDWNEYQTENLVFYTLPGTYADQNIKAIGAAHEKAYFAIQQALEVDYFEPIFYFLYPSEPVFFHATYRNAGFAIDDGGEVHTKWFAANDHQTLGHEMTHVIAYGTLGYAGQALMGEGLASCLDQDNRDYRLLGKALVNNGKYVPLAKMMGDDWFAADPAVAYPESGAFVCYLFDQHGAEAVWDLYVSEDLDEAAQLSLGMNLAALEKAFKAWMAK